ncbi:MAG: hypothetical protein CMK60_02475 [Proteobacteria bacterium]|nr:hypothetical protein [Pseudomonadota bacterium]
MSHFVLAEECIGCGACEFVCPRNALLKTDSFLGLFIINPFICDDCGDCVEKCPVWAIEPDPEWAVCYGPGCPLSSRRLRKFECNVWQAPCHKCGSPLWRQPARSEEWVCPVCDMALRVRCPRVHKLSGVEESHPELVESLCRNNSRG